VALDDLGDELLAGDPFVENTDNETGSTPSNLIESDGQVDSFSSGGNGDRTDSCIRAPLDDSNADPFGGRDCGFTGCTLWLETFGATVAVSGDGDTVVVSDQGSYYPGPTVVETVEVADVYSDLTPINGIRSWGDQPNSVLSGSDVAPGYTEAQEPPPVAGNPACPRTSAGVWPSRTTPAPSSWVTRPTTTAPAPSTPSGSPPRRRATVTPRALN